MAKKTFSIKEIAEAVEGTIQGSDVLNIEGYCALNEPRQNCITFVTVKTQHALEKTLKEHLHSIAFIRDSLKKPEGLPTTCILVKDPQRAMIAILPLFRPEIKAQKGISTKADIADTAIIGTNVTIGAFSVIGEDCIIEDNAVIHPHVVLYQGVHIKKGAIIHSGAIIREFCEVGQNVIIQNGAIIGADGFGYIPNADGTLLAVPQVGIAKLEDNVEIGANSCVDRAALGTTLIDKGTKIDNQVQIGHNTHIGKHSIICGQGGVAGSVQIGDHVVLGARVGIPDHIKVVSGCRFAGASQIYNDILTPGDYAGSPAVPGMEFKRSIMVSKKLTGLLSTMRKQMKEQNEDK